uniref:Mitochondrial import receptor subunit TOM7 homolog n=1 Tax=Gallus gallus TaxID=9031 RepID=A0A8V0X4A4_CHICK
MPKLSKEAKQRLQQLFKGGQFAIRWGFIPVVLYLGFRRGADPGMPEPTIWRAACSDSLFRETYLKTRMYCKPDFHFLPLPLSVCSGDERCGSPALEPADGQRKCLKMHTFQRMRRTLTPADSVSLLMT